MVKLSIHPACVRTFPYTGYLGLTPIKVEGCVCTSLEGEYKPLPAKSITISVRCYESRLGRVGVLHTSMLVEYTELLWSKPDDQEYAEIGQMELPFRISLPAKVNGFSTVIYPDYRVFWRLEATIDHIPITAVGYRQIKRYDLPWIRYDLPPPTPTHNPQPRLDSLTTNHRTPTIRYGITLPTCPIGPLDIVSINIHLLPTDPAVSIRGASLIVERRIQFTDTSTPPSPRELDISAHPAPASSSNSSSTSTIQPHFENQNSSTVNNLSIPSTPRSSSPTRSQSTFDEYRPLVHTPPSSAAPASYESPAKTITTSVAGVESSGCFTLDVNGAWTKTLTFQWPTAKSASRWAIGETLQSEMVSVKFFARIKIIVSSPSGTDSIELSEQELIVVATNATERELALAKYHESASSSTERARAKSKSKSPRRRKRQHAHDPMPVDSTPAGMIDLEAIPHKSRQKTTYATSKGKHSSSRRPHTSPGPRDKARVFNSDHMPVVCMSECYEQRFVDCAHLATTPAEFGTVESTDGQGCPSRHRYLATPPLATNSSSSSSSCGTEAGGEVEMDGKGSAGTSDHEQVWEGEAVKIESQGRRRSSDMLGFAHKLRRITADRFAPRLPVLAHSER